MFAHAGSVIVIDDGFDVSTLIAQMFCVPPWNTKPALSGKKPGSYCAAIGTSTSRCRSITYAPPMSATPCATNRPSGELRVQNAGCYVTSFSTRNDTYT